MLSRDYLSPSRSPDRMKGGGPRKGKYEPTVLGNLSSTRPILASMRSSSVFNCSLLRIRCCLRRRRRRRRRWFRSRDCRRFSLRARRGGLFENGKREKLMPWSFKNSANLHFILLNYLWEKVLTEIYSSCCTVSLSHARAAFQHREHHDFSSTTI